MNLTYVLTELAILLLAIVGVIYLGSHLADWAINRRWHW